ncbi:hypothetical protein [Ralstonia pseudosolanacearum]|uniref:hypothetical protein n=1 Tax=Ralstonia pseudosolanacearum TaxID=1310165 RepID=UPI003CEF5917
MKWLSDFTWAFRCSPFLNRLAYAHDKGLYAIYCDQEACEHYGISTKGVSAALWELRLYLVGYFRGLFVHRVPAYFLEAREQRIHRTSSNTFTVQKGGFDEENCLAGSSCGSQPGHRQRDSSGSGLR